MDQNWAAENLRVIRTLMERSAVYRRALGPISFALGGLGAAASVIGFFFIQTQPQFGCFWLGVSLAGLSSAYFMARRQALKDNEAFWSPPTRRVTQALLPPLAVGLVLSLNIVVIAHDRFIPSQILPPLWILVYGVSLHAAGFFMPRGIKLLGWIFIVAGCLITTLVVAGQIHFSVQAGHGIMGLFFGGLHLAYGAYLFTTERGRNEP